MSENRLCKGTCGKDFPLTEEHFYFRKSAKNGKKYASPLCRLCEKKKASETRRDRYATPDGKAVIDAQTAAYRGKPDKAKAISDRLKERYLLDSFYRDERKANAKRWRGSNPERRRELGAIWFQTNKARLREEWNVRFRTDPAFRLRNNLRHAIWEALRVHGGSKGGRSITNTSSLYLTLDE